MTWDEYKFLLKQKKICKFLKLILMFIIFPLIMTASFIHYQEIQTISKNIKMIKTWEKERVSIFPKEHRLGTKFKHIKISYYLTNKKSYITPFNDKNLEIIQAKKRALISKKETIKFRIAKLSKSYRRLNDHPKLLAWN